MSAALIAFEVAPFNLFPAAFAAVYFQPSALLKRIGTHHLKDNWPCRRLLYCHNILRLLAKPVFVFLNGDFCERRRRCSVALPTKPLGLSTGERAWGVGGSSGRKVCADVPSRGERGFQSMGISTQRKRYTLTRLTASSGLVCRRR